METGEGRHQVKSQAGAPCKRKMVQYWSAIDTSSYNAKIWMGTRIASSDVLLNIKLLPHLISSRLILSSGGGDEAGQHGDT
jgi:hypothetical protein